MEFTEVAEGYIDNTLNHRLNVSYKIMAYINKPEIPTQRPSSSRDTQFSVNSIMNKDFNQ